MFDFYAFFKSLGLEGWLPAPTREPDPVFEELTAPPKVHVSHHLRLDGKECLLLKTGAVPPKAVFMGHTDRHWRWHEGDHLLIVTDSGRTTRYRIDKLRRSSGSMYFAECTFAPRRMEEHFDG